MRISILALAATVMAGPVQALGDCAPDKVFLRGDWGQAMFSVEVADDDAERAKGLMDRPSMPRNAGMLFVYEKPQSVAFWMKNTLIPLDMLFMDETGTVRRIKEMAEPLDTTPIPGGKDIQFVLEINGGLSESYGIDVGTQLRHPAVDQDKAAWPCEGD